MDHSPLAKKLSKKLNTPIYAYGGSNSGLSSTMLSLIKNGYDSGFEGIDYEFYPDRAIINNEKFNRFLFNYNKDKIKNKNLYFIYQFNSSSKTNFISKISKDGFSNNTDFYKFNNLQQLKILLMDEKLFIGD